MKAKNKKKKSFRSKARFDLLLKDLNRQDKAEFGFMEEVVDLLFTWSEMGCMVIYIPVFDMTMKSIDMVELKKTISEMKETDWSNFNHANDVIIGFVCNRKTTKPVVDEVVKTDTNKTIKSHLNSMGLVLGKDGLLKKK